MVWGNGSTPGITCSANACGTPHHATVIVGTRSQAGQAGQGFAWKRGMEQAHTTQPLAQFCHHNPHFLVLICVSWGFAWVTSRWYNLTGILQEKDYLSVDLSSSQLRGTCWYWSCLNDKTNHCRRLVRLGSTRKFLESRGPMLTSLLPSTPLQMDIAWYIYIVHYTILHHINPYFTNNSTHWNTRPVFKHVEAWARDGRDCHGGRSAPTASTRSQRPDHDACEQATPWDFHGLRAQACVSIGQVVKSTQK